MSDIDYALMAGRAYFDTRTQTNRFLIPQGWSLYSRQPETSTGFEASVFESQCSNEYVISFAGTDPSSLNDLLADAGLAIGLGSAQLRQAALYYCQVKEQLASQGITTRKLPLLGTLWAGA